jgi:anti-sigma factor ChrR (cupin superfamily)
VSAAAMKAIQPGARVVRNIHELPYRTFEAEGIAYEGLTYLPLDDERPAGTGLHVIKMGPGAISTAHEHTADEMFYVLEGELVDHDGARYRAGDMVLLRAGTQHGSTTPEGCTLLVYVETIEKPVN